MSIEVGWFVFNINRKDWGPGEVLELRGSDEARVRFDPPEGEKWQSLALLARDLDDGPPPPPPTREQRLQSLMNAFFQDANREGIQELEGKIPRFVAGKTSLWREIEEQLTHWSDTNPEGRHAYAAPKARALLKFLRNEYKV